MSRLRTLLWGRLLNLAWVVSAVLCVAVAAYVIVASQWLLLLSERRVEVAGWVGERLGMQVEIDRLAGEMRFLTPVVHLRGVRLYVKNVTHAAAADQAAVVAPVLIAPTIDIELDTLSSLLTLRPVLGLLRIKGIELTIIEGEDGRFRIKGMPFNLNDPLAAERLRRALMVAYRQSDMLIEHSRLTIESKRLPVTALDNLRLHVHNKGHEHVVAGAAVLRGPGALPVSFVLKFDGEPLVPADVVADLYVQIQPASLEGWLPQREAGGLWLDALVGGGEAWLHLAWGQVTDVVGRLQVDSVAASLADGRKLEGLFDVRTRFHWQANDQGATLALGGLSFQRRGLSWPATDAALTFVRDANDRLAVRGVVGHGSVQMLADFAEVLPQEHTALRDTLARLAPTGVLRDVRLLWDETAIAAARWRFTTDFAQVAWRADGPVPGINNLAGHVEWTPRLGMAALALNNAQIALPTLFADPIVIDDAALRAVWRREGSGWQLRSNRFVLRNKDARASGLFTLTLPAAGESPQLGLLAMIEDGNVAATPRYLPVNIGDGLRNWLLQSQFNGRLRVGSFLFEGPLHKDDPLWSPRAFQMRYEADDLGLNFLAGWPRVTQLDADVLMAAGAVSARGQKGHLLGSVLHDYVVDVSPSARGTSRLRVKSQLSGGVDDAFKIFRDTPLRDVVPGELLRWDGNGRLEADIDLAMLLDKGQPPRVTVSGRIDGATLTTQAHALEVNDVSGELRFDTVAGFSARNLRGLALGSTFTGSARTSRKQGQQQTRIDLLGRVRMQPVSDWLKISALDVLRGEADAAVTLRFDAGEAGGTWLAVNSNLRGITVLAPAPLAKRENIAVDTRLDYQLGTATPRLQLRYGKVLAADLRFRDGVPAGGGVVVGTSILPPEEKADGLVLEGRLATLRVEEWTTFIGRLTGASPTPASGLSISDLIGGMADMGSRLRRANISTDRLDLAGIVAADAVLRMQHEEAGWVTRVDSNALRGQLVLPPGYQARGDVPLRIQLEALTLPETAANTLAASQLLPSSIPRMALALNNIRLGNEHYGSWSFETLPSDDGSVRLRDVRGLWRAMDVRGDGVWRSLPGGHTQTDFVGTVRADDLARVSTAFGFAPNLSSSKATVLFELQWPGRPIDVDPYKFKGDLVLDMRDGRFITGDSRTKALRALGVFNINTWQRRMKLDFSDLYKKGVAFDTLTGNVHIDEGRLSTENLVLKGPSAMFELAGSTDMKTEALNSQLRVTLPVSSNLYVGCLVGLAACAGIVAFEQLWGERLEKMTTLAYEVGGTWADPQVKQIEAVDAKPTKNKGQ